MYRIVEDARVVCAYVTFKCRS